MKRPLADRDTSWIMDSVAGGSRNQSMQLKLQTDRQTVRQVGVADRQTDRQAAALQHHSLPEQVLLVQHLVLPPPLRDEIVVLQPEDFAPEHDPMELVVFPQDHQRRLQSGSLLDVQRVAASGHQLQRIKQRVAVHRGCAQLKRDVWLCDVYVWVFVLVCFRFFYSVRC